MKLSYQWLCEWVDIRDISPEQLADALTNAGLEVEGIEPRNQGVSGVVVGEVIACSQHPNADKLKVCQVNVGNAEPRTIVCGAPNVAAGQRVPTALPGSVLPGGSIGVAKLRGIESQGMLCSAKEIGLETRLLPKEQTEGLYLLPNDAPIGADVVQYLGLDDVVLDVSLTPNRSDCLSIRGFAYEVAALYNRALNVPDVRGRSADSNVSDPDLASSYETGAQPVAVKIVTPRCRTYEAQVMQDVTVGQSPLWMQMRLMAMNVRPISNVVDVTNYVMLEWGQPLHAFDLDEVRERTIVVRQAKPGETILTLDGETRALEEEDIVIADAQRAIGIAGVMGGANSEISDTTRHIVIESAAFDAVSTRRTGQRLGLRSEAQQRFEKGVDPVAVHAALLRAASLLQALTGAKTVGDAIVAPEGQSGQTEFSHLVEFSPARCNGLLGTNIDALTMRESFRRLGFSIEDKDALWQVEIPSRRPDITLEADLVEEVGRLYGLDKIPSSLPRGPVTIGQRNPSQKLRVRTRQVLVGAGLTEVFTYTFTHPAALDALRISEDDAVRTMIALALPMSEERTVLRTHMLPGLAQVASYNMARGVEGAQIFEIGRLYLPDSLPLRAQPTERTVWAGLWFGQTEVGVGQRSRRYDFYDAKGVVEEWLKAFGWLDRVVFQRAQRPWLHPGRTTEVLLDGESIGVIGELHPETAAALELSGAIYADINLDVCTPLLEDTWRVSPLPRYPASRRDLAVIVGEHVAVGDLQKVARMAAESTANQESILESCHVFDVYAGTGIPAGHKSVAIAFTYRAEDRTLTDAEIEQVEEKIVAAWATGFHAQLRAGI